MKGWVGLGVLADNVINLGKHWRQLAHKALRIAALLSTENRAPKRLFLSPRKTESSQNGPQPEISVKFHDSTLRVSIPVVLRFSDERQNCLARQPGRPFSRQRMII